MLKGVSIIVCCYNSALRLPETLLHIARQKVSPDIPWEVIVVNNASTDNTGNVANEEWKNFNTDVIFHVVNQPVTGLSAARAKGIEISAFEYVIFCDDDNWLAPNWVQRVFDIFELNPKIGILGGHNSAVFETSPPDWFEIVKESFAVGEQNNDSADLTDTRGYVWGAGMSFRKSIYSFVRECGFTPLLSGRKGKKLTAGEDTEFCILFRMAGYRIWYFEELKLQHFIPASRLNTRALSKMYRGFGESRYYFDLYEFVIKNSPESFNKRYYRYCVDLIRNWIRAFLSIFKTGTNTDVQCLYFWYSYQLFLTATRNIPRFNLLIKNISILYVKILKEQS